MVGDLGRHRYTGMRFFYLRVFSTNVPTTSHDPVNVVEIFELEADSTYSQNMRILTMYFSLVLVLVMPIYTVY
jgi:hypothetical protein